MKLKKRPKCPFYGFSGIPKKNSFVDKKDNRCALLECTIGDKCQMEAQGFAPDWNKCPLNTKQTNKALSKYKIFPKEQKRGLPVKNWIRHVMSA